MIIYLKKGKGNVDGRHYNRSAWNVVSKSAV